MLPTSFEHVNPVHIRILVQAVLRLYWLCIAGVPWERVYEDPNDVTLDFDELVNLLEHYNDGIQIRRRGCNGHLEPENPIRPKQVP